MIQEIQYVLDAIIHASNARAFNPPHVQAVIQQNTAFLMAVEDANAWINTSTQEVTKFALLAIISVKHV